jgi:hypothetical protein
MCRRDWVKKLEWVTLFDMLSKPFCLIAETTEDLIKFQQTFAQQFATMRVKAMKIERELIDTRMQDQSEKENFNKLQLMKGKLQAEAEVGL